MELILVFWKWCMEFITYSIELERKGYQGLWASTSINNNNNKIKGPQLYQECSAPKNEGYNLYHEVEILMMSFNILSKILTFALTKGWSKTQSNSSTIEHEHWDWILSMEANVIFYVLIYGYTLGYYLSVCKNFSININMLFFIKKKTLITL